MAFEETGEPYSGPDHEYSAGNGSLMRLAPVPLFYMSNPLMALEMSALSSCTTHKHPLAVDACRYMGGLIHGALIGKSKEDYWHQDILQYRDTGKKTPS